MGATREYRKWNVDGQGVAGRYTREEYETEKRNGKKDNAGDRASERVRKRVRKKGQGRHDYQDGSKLFTRL